MIDTKHWRFQLILREAARYRTLRRILEAADPPTEDCETTAELRRGTENLAREINRTERA
jgi:hypothetical protein